MLLPLAFGFGYALQRYVLNGTLGKDPLPSLVVTFGLAIVIQNLLLELFSADPRSIESAGLNTQSMALPGGFAIGVLPLLIFGLALAATAALQWLFNSTRLGRAFRAVSDDKEIAELMGLDSNKVYALATAIAFVLIGVAGVLQGMRTTVSPADGPLLLLFAFEAVIIGWHGFVLGHVAGCAAAGRDAADWLSHRPGLGHLVRTHRVPAGVGAAAAGVVPEDAGLSVNRVQVIRSNASSRIALGIGVLLVLIAGTLPFWAPEGNGSSWMRDFVEIACYFIFAMMWNLLAGYGGMVSIGQQAFFGFGGYAMLVLGNFTGINPFVAVPLGAIAAAAIAVPVSYVAFRLQGGYFAIGTWVIAEVFRLSFANVSEVGGGSGTSLTALRGIEKATRENATYWMALVCVVTSIALVYLFLRSKRGLALLAIRDNEVAAESQGIDVMRMKLAVYLVAAFGAGLAGALYFLGNLRISPDAAFSVNWTAFAIFMVIIGGIGRIEGPIVGALIFWALNKAFSDYGTWYLLGLGLLAIVITIYFKQGLWGWAQSRWGWSLFPTQRTLKL